MRVPKLITLHLAFFGLAGAISASCFRVDYPVTAFRCNPSQQDACPDDYICCSDDPAAIKGTDVTGVLPAYVGRYQGSETGLAIFSGANNVFSTSGLCVQKGALPAGAGLVDPGAVGCPVPCNPEWGSTEVGKICGMGAICCQSVEITTNDCVVDSGTGCWRPATGADIFDNSVSGQKFAPGMGDPWAGDTHDTHQDPAGKKCGEFALGNLDVESACFRALTVGDQRGLCLAISADVQFCPLAQPEYIDACEGLNQLVPGC